MSNHRTEANAFAGQVSKTLRTADYRPLPSGTSRSRQGCRVNRRGPVTCSVSLDYDYGSQRAFYAAHAAAILEAAGYTVEVPDGDLRTGLLIISRTGA